ncbi:sigma-70 family RNA polymerase sigma factor [Evansella clarkii]|uniref:sigma-70 family RNA polymerase sigma factor n=1 Tax=Evansella clarkii TaxID=79879 RepID=UPI0009966DA6|nr:sigma-70 family RNA polymerase sigma factor [Evansella clarkii]
MAENSLIHLLDFEPENVTDPLMRGFLNIDSNYNLLMKARELPCEENTDELNQAFKRYYTELQLINYISHLINHYSRDFYRKKNREKYFYVFAFEDESLFDSKVPPNQPGGNTVGEESLIEISSLLEAIQDKTIYEALIRLTDRQLFILNLHFVYQLSHTEIAEKLNVSQQSVSKTIKKSLNKLRNSIVYGGK